MSWEPGRDRVTDLIHAGELEPVTPDERVARRLLDDAGRHLDTATAAVASDDLSGAYQLAYDALRKIAAALRIRRSRNRFEYPDSDTAGPSRDDVHDAITTATAARDAAATILDRNLLTPW